MIIDQVVLHNFGLYGGRNVVLFTPPSPDQPVTLVGGMNGAGKTTLLEAIRLALYGKLAESPKRGSRGYLDYLESSIHNGGATSEGAAVEVKFRTTSEGFERTYQVNRSWTRTRSGVREQVEVLRNDKADLALTEGWLEFMEGLLPVRLSHLFFFDGEQVEQFADPASSAELLSTAIHSLLGLDLVDQLTTDLQALERRKRVKEASTRQQDAVKTITAELDALQLRRDSLLQERAAQQNTLDQVQKQLTAADTRFRAEGGEQFSRRAELEADQKRFSKELEMVQERLRALAAEATPLAMLMPQLGSILTHAQEEERAHEAQLLSGLLAERDDALLTQLSSLAAMPPVLQGVRDWLTRDRAIRIHDATIPVYLHLEGDAVRLLQHLLEADMNAVNQQVRAALRDEARLRELLTLQQRLLGSIPSEEAIAGIIKERQNLQDEQALARGRMQALEEELARVERELEHRKAKLARALETVAEERLASFETTRLLEHSDRVRNTLERYRASILTGKVSRIETAILESYQQLLHKQSLVSRISISTENFALSIFDPAGQLISPDRLSAGERQLLAVSILWGLARATGRRLPVVIDTPMGRLDSNHRLNLVERYFPKASHQVILLSTDEEIDSDFYRHLRPSIGHQYRLQYSDQSRSTMVFSGYFSWDKK